MPGPPLRGTLSPPATSMTKIWTSTSARLNVAVRLSPPLSSRSSSGANRRSRSSSASRFSLMSSRIAVCGQQPVCTPTMRSTVEHALALEDGGVLGGEDVVRDDGDADARRRRRGTGTRPARSCRCPPDRRCRRAGPRRVDRVAIVRRRGRVVVIGAHGRLPQVTNSRLSSAACPAAAISTTGPGPAPAGRRARPVGGGQRPRATTAAPPRPVAPSSAATA